MALNSANFIGDCGMKKLFMTWTKGPAGNWEQHSPEPVTGPEAAAEKKFIEALRAELKVVVLADGINPNVEGK